MTNEQKQDFTLRISQANKSALVVILYDIFLAYAKEAEEASPAESAFHIAIANARGALSELIDSLRMEYDIAQSTYQLYRFVERELIRADIGRSADPIPAVIRIMQCLRDAYAEVAKEDASAPLMKNTDIVYAGMTYGKHDVMTGSSAAGTNRGYLV